MKYILFLLVLLICTTSPVFAQEPKIGDFVDPVNPSLFTDKIDIPYHVFNTISRDAEITELGNHNPGSWQLALQNDLLYGNPNGNGVIRLFDATIEDKFIEVGMGSPPNKKFWIAVQLPEEGYVVVHNKLERGWLPGAKVILAYSNSAGLTINNGERIVLSNLDVEGFEIKAYSVWGMEGSQDPPAATGGHINLEILSGDPTEGPLHMFPFILVGCIGIGIAILLVTKKRS